MGRSSIQDADIEVYQCRRIEEERRGSQEKNSK
jgi:hypothetical protein